MQADDAGGRQAFPQLKCMPFLAKRLNFMQSPPILAPRRLVHFGLAKWP